MDIRNRLNNDVNNAILESPYFVNGFREVNKLTSKEGRKKEGYKDLRFGRRYVNGGVVVDNNPNFNAYYQFELAYRSKLRHVCVYEDFVGKSSDNFKQFIDDIMTSPRLLVDGNDLSKELDYIKNIRIRHATIDYRFVNDLKRYFHNLESIEFIECTIKADADFSKVNSTIELSGCTIEDLISFRDTESIINIYKANIKKITPCTINTPSIHIEHIEDDFYIPIKELFLKVNFPKLKELHISPGAFKNYSYENDLIFLPYSAPNLEKLDLEGKVRNLDFLERLSHLYQYSIRSVCDNSFYDFSYPYVTDRKERIRLLKKNKELAEYLKVLHPSIPDKVLMCYAETRRIDDLKNTFYRIKEHYDGEYEDLINGRTHEFAPDQLVTDVFMARYGCLDHTKYEEPDFFSNGPLYKIRNNIMYNDAKSWDDNHIVYATKFIYHPSGIPIMFDNMSSFKPKTIDELKQLIKDNGKTDEELNREFFLESLEENQIKDYGDFDHAIEDLPFRPTPKEVYAMNKRVGMYMYEDYRFYYHSRYISEKNDHYLDLLLSLIEDNYDKFTVEEKTYMLQHIDDYAIRHHFYKAIDDYYFHLLAYEHYLEDDINAKTNGLYGKYKAYLKSSYLQAIAHRHNEVYDKEITLEDIEEIKSHLRK